QGVARLRAREGGVEAGAFFGADATRAVSAVSAGERTQSVPVMSGPRTDVRRRRGNRSGITSVVVILLLAIAGLSYYLLTNKTVTTTSMPNVIGQSISSATSTLRTNGLQIGEVKLIQSNKPKGTVVSTTPAAGKKVSSGQSVSLKVSLGTSTKPVTVPNVTNMSLSAAETLLQQKNLAYTVNQTSSSTSGATPNTVLSQSPAAGTSARTGDKVVLTILAPTTTYAVPPVAGQTQVAATQTLVQQGLSVSSTTTKCSNTVASGLVISTNPPVGTQVKAGTSIILVTSSGFCNVYVPDVIGSTQSAAESTMTSQGLQTSVSSADPTLCSPSQIGTVLSQNPSGGTSVLYNSTVDLSVCDTSTQPGSG
ncbi:MAG: PASTA domain-containing protein, partial [Acidobacteria bacterium]|nr:PASTA domain-containing protein [Acidobacteriota bacterium]